MSEFVTVGGVSLNSIMAAKEIIQDYVHRTPVQTSETLNSMAGTNLYFKCEFLQKTGSFKARGACNAVLKNPVDCVVAHSSGNHAQALAWAAKCKGITAHVVMPKNSPKCKQRAVAEYGAIITLCEPTLRARETAAQEIVDTKHARLIHSYNDPDIISGQGTVALEFLEQVPQLDGIIVAIGGGGLCSGVALAAKSLNPNIKIIAAEPAAANDAYRSKKAGHIICNEQTPNTLADGLLTNLGSNTWPIVKDYVDDIILVSEEDIIYAMQVSYERMKCVIEPSAAVAVAITINGELQAKYPELKHVGVILCG
eukprot:gene13011-27453_t